MKRVAASILAVLPLVLNARGQWVTPQFTLNTASGWQAFGFAANLTEPRHLAFDALGQLLVVERDTGITAFTLNPDGSAASRSVLLSFTDLNTAIALSEDGTVLFASSANDAWGWDYDASTLTLTNQRLLVTGMNNSDHVTRTILRSKAHPELLVIARGSAANLDYASANITAGPAQVRVFDWTSVPTGGHNWLDGAVLSYGTRNEVGLDEDGAGHVWGVENSADNLVRVVNGTSYDIHQDNPAEKLHHFGDALSANGTFYGYPYCFSVWNPSLFPASDSFQVGDWFSQQRSPYAAFDDAWCNANAKKPELIFKDHSAPLDMKFGPPGDSNLYVGFHGSWNRQPPTGYKVVVVPGSIGYDSAWSPDADITSTTGYYDILYNTDEALCPGSCFRPVGLAWNAAGDTLYVASDETGEVFAVKRV